MSGILGVFFGLFYPLIVPAISIFLSGKLLLGSNDFSNEDNQLIFMKGLKIFEHLGQYFLFSIL